MAKTKKSMKGNQRLGFFGHFGDINLGNESTLQAMLHHVRRHQPTAQLMCICTDPKAITRRYGIEAVSMNGTRAKALWLGRNRLLKLFRKIAIGLPCELYRWCEAINVLRTVDTLVVPGTGLLTDLCGIRNWGPYNVFKWSAAAKICRCKVLFVSVGAGPIHSRLAKWCVKTALASAVYRSYRDHATMKYLDGIGFPASKDKVYPDLAYSLPEEVIPTCKSSIKQRSVVGVGLMMHADKIAVDGSHNATYGAYLKKMAAFVGWLLDHDYDVRLLIGDICDKPVIQEFKLLLRERLGAYDVSRVIDEPIDSVENLLSQLAATDIVVATRFHNVLLALLLNKPVLSISFHQKCVSLMSDIGLMGYSQDIRELDGDKLIGQFGDLQENAAKIKTSIMQSVVMFRRALDEQYRILFTEVSPGGLDVRGSDDSARGQYEDEEQLSVSGRMA
jgi:polysaccharide pyruvyl transferase WcaK-like protein